MSRMPPPPGPLATPKVDSKWSFQICSQSENGNLQTLESFFYQTACLLNSKVLLAPNIHRTKVSPAIMSSPNNKLAAPHNCNCHLKLLIATLPPEMLWTTSHLRFSSTAHFTCHLQLLAEEVFISLATAPFTCKNLHQVLH